MLTTPNLDEILEDFLDEWVDESRSAEHEEKGRRLDAGARAELKALKDQAELAMEIQIKICTMRRDPTPGKWFSALYNWLDRFDLFRENVRKVIG